MNERRDIFQDMLLRVICHLVRKDYFEVEKMTDGIRLRKPDIDHAIMSYGRSLAIPESSHFDLMEIVEIEGAVQKNGL